MLFLNKTEKKYKNKKLAILEYYESPFGSVFLLELVRVDLTEIRCWVLRCLKLNWMNLTFSGQSVTADKTDLNLLQKLANEQGFHCLEGNDT